MTTRKPAAKAASAAMDVLVTTAEAHAALLCAANDLTIRVNTLADWLDQVAAYAICADVARFTALPGWTPRVLGPGHIDCRRGNDVDCDWVCHYPDGTWGCQRDGRVVQGKANAQEAWDAAGKVQ